MTALFRLRAQIALEKNGACGDCIWKHMRHMVGKHFPQALPSPRLHDIFFVVAVLKGNFGNKESGFGWLTNHFSVNYHTIQALVKFRDGDPV